MFEIVEVESNTQSKKYHAIADIIFEQSFFDAYDINEFWHIEDDDSFYFLVQHKGETIGVLSFSYEDEGAVIETLGLLPDHQGKGLGRYLITQIEEEIFYEAEWMAVEFIADNTNLFNFYFSCGFEVVTIEVYVYNDSDIVFQDGILEFKKQYQGRPIPDFIPWVNMVKAF